MAKKAFPFNTDIRQRGPLFLAEESQGCLCFGDTVKWTEYWGALKNGCIFFFPDEKSIFCIREIPLYGAKCSLIKELYAGRANCCRIDLHSTSYVLWLQSPEEFLVWVKGIQQAAIVESGGHLKVAVGYGGPFSSVPISISCPPSNAPSAANSYVSDEKSPLLATGMSL